MIHYQLLRSYCGKFVHRSFCGFYCKARPHHCVV